MPAQETGGMEKLAMENFYNGYAKKIQQQKYTIDYDLGLIIEQDFILQQPFRIKHYSLSAYWKNLRSQGVDEVWSQTNYVYLSKPEQERTGEGLIPDIQIPIPGFGKTFGSGAQIKVNGNQKITAGNEITSYNQKGIDYDANKTNSDSRINIKQEQKINLEGVIGERVHVLINYDSEADIDKRSKVRLRYEGREDEVLQSLEAGDTEFSLSGSSLVGGLTTVHKGLFGLKGVARLAGFELTAIASKDEGESQSSSFSGSNKKDSLAFYDKDFIPHRIFEIAPYGLADNDSIEAVKVCIKNDYSSSNTNSYYLIDRSWKDFLNRDTLPLYGPVKMEVKTEITDFILDDPRTGRIILNSSIDDNSVLGVAYKTRKGYYPDQISYDSIGTLMLIKPSNCQPSDSLNGYCWEYEKRNYYDFRSKGIDFSTLTMKLQHKQDNEYVDNDSIREVSYLKLLGLELNDGKLNDYYINQEDGYFHFPEQKPFISDSLSDKNPDIYLKKNLDISNTKYRFVITYKTTVAVYYLQVSGRLIEGTVRVTLNGTTVSSSDYVVDYDMATVTFNERIKDQLKNPNANLTIDYQYMPLFALSSKTLAGLRGIYKFGDNAVLGGTWLYRSEKMPDEKPRLGEEPKRIIVAGLDGSYQAAPDFLTRMADAIPLVETEAPSSFQLTGEIAGNFPNPNTKGQVYIDDMDGSKVSDEFNLGRSGWVRSSIPFGKVDTMLAKTFYWYNPTTQVTMAQINPDITDETQKNETIRTLLLRYNPEHSDTVNSWAGITQLLSKTGLDFSESKLLNLWIQGSKGIVHIDIGKNISEDQVWWHGKYKTEFHPANDSIDAEPLSVSGEPKNTDENDVGVDGVKGLDADWIAGSNDDGNDDYAGNTVTEKINGTEGNGYYDTEDLKMNGIAPGEKPQTGNNYYSFRFNLSQSIPNIYGWHQLSALLDTARAVGANLGWNSIQYARIWIDSCPAPAEYQIALIEVSGNRWLEQGVQTVDTASAVDSTENFTVKVKNNRDNPDYILPPDTEQKDDQGRIEFEQSLVFDIDSLRPGHYVNARKTLREGENNFSGYQTLKIWVHSNESTHVKKSFALRLVGNDTSSYYQYKQSVYSGWQDISMDIMKFSDLKKLPFPADTTYKIRTSGNYSLKGNPSLLSLSRIALCVFNDDTLSTNIFSDEIWFDELRLDDVRRDRGTAITSGVSVGLADFLSLNASYNKTGSHWYGINSSGTGSGVKNISYALSGTFNTHKIYLERLGLNLPISFRYGMSRQYNEYGADDIRLSAEESKAQMATTHTRSVNLSLTKSLSQWWLPNLTIDRITTRFGWARNASDNRTSADSSSDITMNLGYQWSPGVKRSFKAWPGLRFYYLPSLLRLGWNGIQTRRWHWDKLTNVINRNGSETTRSAQGQLSWQIFNSLNYTFNTARNLKDKYMQGQLAERFGLGSEISRSQKADYNITLAWMKIIKPNLSFSSQYNEGHSLAAAADKADSLHILSVSNSNTFSLNGGLEIGKWLSKMAGLRNKANDDSAEAGTPRWLLVKLDKLFNRLSSVQASFSRDLSSQASGLTMQPGWPYQLGLAQDTKNIPRYLQTTGDRNTIRNSYSLSTSLDLMRLSLNMSFRRTDDTNKVGGAENSSRSVTWPDLRASIIGLEKLRLWKNIMTSSNITTAYSRVIDKTWENKKGLVRISTKNGFSPLMSWNGRWRKGVNSSLGIDYSSQKTDYVSGQARNLYSQTFKVNSAVSYSFSAPQGFKLDFWKLGKKRIKFNSDLNIQSQFSYSIRGDRNVIPPSELSAFNQLIFKSDYQSICDLNYISMVHEFSISPIASYNFTRSITGSASFNYSFSRDKISAVNNNSRTSVNATVNILF